MTWTQQSKGEWSADTGTAYLRVVQVGWRLWKWTVTADDRTVASGVRATMDSAQRAAAQASAKREGL
jgi:hypothetical protein